MRIFPGAAIALLFAAAFLFPSVRAQSADEWDRLQKVRSGTGVIIDLQSGQSVKGKFRGTTGDRLGLSTGGRTIAVFRSEIKSVHRAKRGSMIGRALIGAAAGAGLGLGVGVALVAASKDPLAGAAGVLVGVPAGAAIGAATTGKSKRGELLYYAP